MANKLPKGLVKYLLASTLTVGLFAPPIFSQKAREEKPPSFVYEYTDTSNYPESFKILYGIKNEFRIGGKTLSGGGKFTKDSNSVILAVRFDHPREKRLMVFEERDLGGGKTEYSEYEYDFLKGKENYNRCDTFFVRDFPGLQTLPGVISKLLDQDPRNLHEETFYFGGQRTALVEHKLKLKRMGDIGKNFWVEAKIEKNNPKVSGIRAIFESSGIQKQLPIYVGVDYKVKWSSIPLPFGLGFKTFEMPAHLVDSLDSSLFIKPKK